MFRGLTGKMIVYSTIFAVLGITLLLMYFLVCYTNILMLILLTNHYFNLFRSKRGKILDQKGSF